jgi:oxalate decarboxylase/phosphoglucose isomerase-like protein (cupin superfamily)
MSEIHCIDLSEEIKADDRGISLFPWQGRFKVPGDLPATFHLISIRPGQSRGHHLHPGQAEYLYPFHGRAVFIWEAASGQVRERVISGETTLIHIPPGLAHAVTNPGPELLYLLAWREVSGPGPGEPETVPHPLGRVTL